MEKKFGVVVLGEESSKKLYTYLDAEIEARKLVKKLNKTAYIFEIHSKVESSVKVTKIEEYRTLNICEINEIEFE
jgi:type II secretory pathway component PulC